MRRSVRMNHIHTTLTLSFFLFIAFPHSHSQPPSPSPPQPRLPPPLPLSLSLCAQQSYICNINMPAILDPFWEESPTSQCNDAHPSSQLMCYAGYEHQNLMVKDINHSTHTMSVVPTDTVKDVCSPDFRKNYENLSITLLEYYGSVHNVTVFLDGCPLDIPKFPSKRNFECGDGMYYFEEGWEDDLVKEYPLLKDCKERLRLPTAAPLNQYDDSDDGAGVLQQALNDGFGVYYDVPQHCTRCNESNCGSNGYDGHVVSCEYYCPDQHCSPPKRSTLNVGRKIAIGVGSAAVGALIVGICVYLFIRRRKNSYVMSYIQSRSLSSDPSSKDTEKGSQSYTQSIIPGVHLFSYEELEVATNYFDSTKELGEGGFGTVYFGKLRDGRSVAVKRLYENNYRIVAQFMNEIKILTRIDHPNLVKLFGCTSRHSRELLLVYEYISNGTVADHLHGHLSKPGTLPWHIRMNIAVETASALKFLHLKGIIHRDVKTNNILLESNFCVKVADFGLSRLFPHQATHVSTAPQGTPGYVDPEYHECYQLTNKSDVYSFGVVLVELISSLPAVDITRHRHEINLANMAINKIHNQTLQELVDRNLGFESDFKIRKMISGVAELAFQCLQSSKDMRPSMEEVVETLKDIQSDGKNRSQPEVMDISSTSDEVVLLKDDPPPPSPDSKAVSNTTTPNTSC